MHEQRMRWFCVAGVSDALVRVFLGAARFNSVGWRPALVLRGSLLVAFNLLTTGNNECRLNIN